VPRRLSCAERQPELAAAEIRGNVRTTGDKLG